MKELVKSVMAVFDPAFWIRAVRAGWRDAISRRKHAIGVVHPFGPVHVERALNKLGLMTLGEVAKDASVISIDMRHAFRDGAAPPSDLIAIGMLATVHRPKGVLEIGTFDGSTTRNLAMTLPDAHIHTLDLPPDASGSAVDAALPMDDLHLVAKRRVGEAFLGTPEATRVTQHLGDSAKYDLTGIKEPLTFFYIDGAHTYEYVRSDTIRCMEVAAGECGIVWHDVNFTHEGVVAWMVQMREAGLPVMRIAGTNLGYLRCTPTRELTVKLRALPQRPTV
jgi:hypothetical protein